MGNENKCVDVGDFGGGLGAKVVALEEVVVVVVVVGEVVRW